jgi:ERCC4-type nuclease
VITSAIIDSRESAVVKRLTFGGIPTTIMALDAGDVLCVTDDACQILIERKTPSDLLSTLRSKRFFPQVERMLEVTPWCYVVITGQLYRDRDGLVTVKGAGHTGWNYDSVQGALLTAQEMGAGVLYCGPDDYEATVIRICNRDRGTVRVKPPREGYLLKDGEAALAALPGIGPERVQALVDALGSPGTILEWLTDLENKHQVPGVGDGTKRAVKAALGLEGELLKIIPWTAQESSYTPNGGFIAAGDELAMQFLKEASEHGE